MGMYEEAKFHDILEPLMPLFARGDLWLDPKDWKIKFNFNAMTEKPWLYTKLAQDRNCFLWRFYFEHFDFIPKNCRKCWKITCKMDTVRKLMKMHELQDEMGLASKCGYEEEGSRWFARKGGLYSAFWYVPMEGGKEEGFRLLEEVREKILGSFSSDLGVRLKKGCSEMELRFGDTKKWDEIAKGLMWEGKEKLLDMFFDHEELMQYVSDDRMQLERSIVRTHIITKVISFAAANGDMTYMDFTDRDFVPEVTRYEKGEESNGADND